MVLLPGCGCCGGGEPYTCWRNLDSLICKPTSEGAPSPEYVAVDQYDDSGKCYICKQDMQDVYTCGKKPVFNPDTLDFDFIYQCFGPDDVIGPEWEIVSTSLSDGECASGCLPEVPDAIQCYRKSDFPETACGTSGDFNLSEWSPDFERYDTLEECEQSDCPRKAGVWCVNDVFNSATCRSGYYDSYPNFEGWTFHSGETCITKNCCLDESGESIELENVVTDSPDTVVATIISNEGSNLANGLPGTFVLQKQGADIFGGPNYVWGGGILSGPETCGSSICRPEGLQPVMKPCSFYASIGVGYSSNRGEGSSMYYDYDLDACDGSDINGDPYPGGCYPLKQYLSVFAAIANGDCDFTKWMQGKASIVTVTDALGKTFKVRFEPGGGFIKQKTAPTKEEPMTQTIGPGTHLKNMLATWGIHAKKGGGCKCKDMEVKMNRWGSDCSQHMDAIVDHLQAEAKKRNLPFVRQAGEMLVKRAIKRFEKES